MSSRNLTVSLPDELVRRAKVVAAQRDTSISALVAEMLENLVGEVDYDDLWAAEEAAMSAGLLSVGEITWTRDDVHAR